ncbi:MAG: bifunctional folylpolyglutamate synthase/dihydrofolate synthase [Actinomycetota bacterium]
MRPGTERVAALVEALGHPQHSYPVVHVSGTNAKFSVVSIVGALLGRLGLTVGAYTSPHLETVRERITLAGTPIAEETFATTVSYLRPYLEGVEREIGDELTWFELLTVMAFEAFFDRAVHAAAIEVGLGGEYDATNVADAKVAIVTNISLDHVRQFGRDLHKAAWEKGGIIKTDTFVVTGILDDELFGVVDGRARERNAADVALLGRDFHLVDRRSAVGGQLITVQGLHATYDDVFLSVFGEHQATNAALAIAACEAFGGGPLSEEEVRAALGLLQIPGRLEVVGRRPLILCDGAHNIAASAAVRDAIVEDFTYDRLILVAGMVGTKLVEEVLAEWAPLVGRAFVAAPDTERAAEPARLATALEAGGLAAAGIRTVQTVAQALEAALDEATEDDLVLVFGSFYTVGEARGWLRSRGVLAQA